MMTTTRLGRTGLEVSRLWLGCMSYGEPDRGSHAWTLGEPTAGPFCGALDLGLNFFDTANVYSDGTSEQIVGRALLDFATRDQVVIATKVHGRMRAGPNGAGLSRKAIFSEDRCQPEAPGHRPCRPLPDPPLGPAHADRGDAGGAARRRQGRQGALHRRLVDVRLAVRPGALHVAERHGWTRFVAMQNYLNLLYREEEREMLPLCEAEGIGVMPWSPLARGRLTRDWDSTSARLQTDEVGRSLYANTAEADRRVVEALGGVATRLGLPRAQVALAWVLQKPGISAPIVDATRLEQLDDAVAALSVQLTPEDIAALEAP